jgi:hypothetical protein
MSKKIHLFLLSTIVTPFLWSSAAQAYRKSPQFPNITFFITSKSGPDGANFGDIEGADKYCKALATKVGAGNKTWRAYLSTRAAGGKPAINARDRIGKGPWVNTEGMQVAANVNELYPDKSKINVEIGRSENGRRIPGRRFVVNQHDMLTGSTADGRAYPLGEDVTCGNWTKNGEGRAKVGHQDRMGLRDDAPLKSWNSAHTSRDCSAANLKRSGGVGLLYCFAAD